MTWREFKEEVDRQLAELALSEDTDLEWIDVGSGDDGIAVSKFTCGDWTGVHIY